MKVAARCALSLIFIGLLSGAYIKTAGNTFSSTLKNITKAKNTKTNGYGFDFGRSNPSLIKADDISGGSGAILAGLDGLPYVMSLFSGIPKQPRREDGKKNGRDGKRRSPKRSALLALIPVFAAIFTALLYMLGCIAISAGSVHSGIAFFLLATTPVAHAGASYFLPKRHKPFCAWIWEETFSVEE